MTQRQMVLEYLEEHDGITNRVADRQFGIMRLGAVIYDLRAEGNNIKTTLVTSKNRYGKYVTYALYSLEDDREPEETV